jgi:hypothetical protein
VCFTLSPGTVTEFHSNSGGVCRTLRDTSNIEDMSQMFGMAESFDRDISACCVEHRVSFRDL